MSAPEKPPAVAVIGAGRWGSTIARTIKRSGIAELKAVYDRDAGKAYSLGQELGVEVYDDIDRIPIDELDGVIVAVSIDQLFHVAIRLIEKGANIFIEKPVGQSLDEVKTIESKSRRKGVIVFPGFIMRFDPSIVYIYSLVREREGQVENIYAYRLSRRPPGARRHSIIYDLAIHDIDTANMLTNSLCEPKKVLYGYIDNLEDQCFTAYLRCGKAVAYIHTDGYSALKIRKTIAVFRDQVVEADSVLKQIFIRHHNQPKANVLSVRNEEPLVRELKAFTQLLRNASTDNADIEPTIPTIEDAVKAHIVIEKSLRKATPHEEMRRALETG